MRQLKSFLKQKKRGRCKCLTLNRWRCWDFCTCANECWEVEASNLWMSNAHSVAPVVEPTPIIEPIVVDDNDDYVEPEIPDEVLENPSEESLDDLNS